jgi:hypothetical protein
VKRKRVESSRRGRERLRGERIRKKNVESELAFDIAYDMNYSSTVTFFFFVINASNLLS